MQPIDRGPLGSESRKAKAAPGWTVWLILGACVLICLIVAAIDLGAAD